MIIISFMLLLIFFRFSLSCATLILSKKSMTSYWYHTFFLTISSHGVGPCRLGCGETNPLGWTPSQGAGDRRKAALLPCMVTSHAGHTGKGFQSCSAGPVACCGSAVCRPPTVPASHPPHHSCPPHLQQRMHIARKTAEYGRCTSIYTVIQPVSQALC